MAHNPPPPKETFFTKIKSFLSYVLRIAFNYLFPVLLIAIEAVIRVAYSTKDLTFIGPTLASIGLGFLLPLISIKQENPQLLSQQTLDELKKHNLTVAKTSAMNFLEASLFFLTVGIGLWIWSLQLSITTPSGVLFYVPTPYWPGLISYFLGISLSEKWKTI